jgi:hypothetical protein
MEGNLPAGLWHRRDTEGDEVRPVTLAILDSQLTPDWQT